MKKNVVFSNSVNGSGIQFHLNTIIMDREQVFHWVKEKDINSIINFLKTGKKSDKEDSYSQQAVGYFLNEVVESTINSDPKELSSIFDQLFVLHTNNFYKFSDEQFEKIIVFLVSNSKREKDAHNYAQFVPNNALCAEIIAKYNESKPKPVEHTQESNIKVENIITVQENLTKSIFNSRQEILFFKALRNCFPNHYIYPNIALSSILKLAVVENALDISDKRFFYSTTLDFVIIDQFNDFKPILAIELDSEWHRFDSQSEKDRIKNKIIKAAGLPFFRIEHTSKYKTMEEFEKVILDITKKTDISK